MFILDWYRQLKEIRREYTEEKPCESCEVLKTQVEQLREDNQKLLTALLVKPTVETTNVAIDNVTPIKRGASHIPWRVRQQQLEAEDKQRARLIREAPKPIPDTKSDTKLSVPTTTTTTNEELEEDLGLELNRAEQYRESTKN